MPRTISPEIPAVVATQLIISRSWQSRAKATRMAAPFQHVNSSTSEHQWQFERMVATGPSCSRGLRRPMWGFEQPVLLHQPVDPLGVNRGVTFGSPLALQERGDPAVPIGRSRVDQATDCTGELDVASALSGPRWGLPASRRSIIPAS